MKILAKKKHVWISGCAILFIMFVLSSCVYDKEFSYTNDRINNLNRKTSGLQESIDTKLSSISSSQADIVVEISKLQDDIKALSGRVEDNEHMIKYVVEKDLGEQDAVRSDLAKLGELVKKIEELETALRQQQEYLGLELLKKEEAEPQIKEEITGEQPAISVENSKSREQEAYDLSLSLFREEKYEQALEGFKRFLSEYPKSDLADNSQFWIGECFMGLKQYEQAILAYQDVVKNYPKENKVPNAMLRQAIAFLEINDKISSKLLLKKVIKQFPDSSEAKIAKTKLDTIK